LPNLEFSWNVETPAPVSVFPVTADLQESCGGFLVVLENVQNDCFCIFEGNGDKITVYFCIRGLLSMNSVNKALYSYNDGSKSTVVCHCQNKCQLPKAG